MTFKEYIKENKIENILCYNEATCSYFFQAYDKENNCYNEGEIKEDHIDFELLQDEYITNIDTTTNKGYITLCFDIPEEEEEEKEEWTREEWEAYWANLERDERGM